MIFQQTLDFIRVLIGTYEPIKYQVVTHYVDSSGVDQMLINEVIPNGISGVNFEYLIVVAITLVPIVLTYHFTRWSINYLITGKQKIKL